MPLMTVLILPLLVLVGLAFDTGLMLNSKNQLSQVARHAALSALSQFVKSLAEVEDRDHFIIEEAILSSQKRAAEVSRTNVTLADKNLGDPSEGLAKSEDQIGVYAVDGVHDHRRIIIGYNQQALLEFGQYYFTEKNELGRQACYDRPPCFRPRNLSHGEYTDRINAVRFTMQVPRNNPINTFFLKLIGIKDYHHRATAIATLTPRNDVFLIDLSPTVYHSNYLPRNIEIDGSEELGTGTSSRFSFFLDESEHSAQLGNYPSVNTVEGICGEDTQKCQVLGVDGDKVDNQNTWNEMKYSSGTLTCPSGSCPAQYHTNFKYRTDYRVYKIDFEDAQSQVHSEYFLVHSFDSTTSNDAQLNFPKPEPLASILSAVHKGMDILSIRALVNDKLGIFGFDSDRNELNSNYGLDVSEKPRYLPMNVPNLNNPDFRNFYEASRLGSRSDFNRFLQLAFFPRPDRFSDLHAAFYSALLKISESNTYTFGKNSIFMFTDGLANCVHRTDVDSDGHISIPYNHDDLELSHACNPVADNTFHSIKSITSADFIKAFTDRNVSVNIALIGDLVGAHYVVRKSHREGCVDNIEAAQFNSHRSFVNSGIPTQLENEDAQTYADRLRAYLDALDAALEGSETVYITNELYKLVHATKGLWIPILPQLISGGQAVVFDQELNEACDNLDPASATPANDRRLKNYTLSSEGQKVTDGEGRILFDPQGRTPQQQMEDAMEAVLQSPFMLVE